MSVAKEELGLELPELESAAVMVLEEENSRNNGEENLNNIVESLEKISVIENAFAVSGNDNENEESLLPPSANLICNSTLIQREGLDSDDDSSDEDSSDDSDDDDSDDDSSDDSDNEDDDDDDSSSSSSASLDSEADSENEDNLILKNETH